jgi:protein TonB
MLGAFGAHRFYLGYTKSACAQILATVLTAGIAGVWGVLEGLAILGGVFARDACGHAMTHRNAIHWLTATSASLGLHLGAVFATQYSSVMLLPPPSGVNSIELTATFDSAAASPAVVETAPPQHRPIEIVTATEPLFPRANQSVASATLPPESLDHVMLSRVDSVDAELQDRRPLAVELPETPVRPCSPPKVSPLNTREPAAPAESDPNPPRPPRTEPKVNPLVAEFVATPSRAQDASREDRGVQSDAAPERLAYSKPVYPPELEARGITGLVKLRVRVGADGRVRSASVYRTSGFPAFDQAALDVIDSWRFRPARRAGIPVEMEIAVPIRFVIQSTEPR